MLAHLKRKKKVIVEMKIGLLGGIGPEATACFYKDLIKGLQKSGINSNTDFPQIIINSIPAPELIQEIATSEMIDPYSEGIRELDSMNVDVIAMLCNTVHIFIEELQANVSAKIIDLPKLLVKELKRKNTKKVLVLATKLTIKSKLYDDKSFETIIPNNKDLGLLSRAIFDFNKGEKYYAKKNVMEVIQKYNKDIDMIILGCTELALIASELNLKVINPMELLLKELITITRKTRKNQNSTQAKSRFINNYNITNS